MADNIEIQIRALVQGLADVKALVAEIQKLPGAGAGIGGLSTQFAGVRRELGAAATEIRGVGTQAQASLRGVASASSVATKGLNDTTRAGKAVKQNLAEVSQGAAALGRAVSDAFQGNILGALRSASAAIRTNLNFRDLFASSVPAIEKVGASLVNTEKLAARFASTLGTAAKNPLGALSGKLFTDFGIEAEKALVNPQLALQKFVTSLALIPDATGRAAAAAEIFGASTASLLPTIEAMVAAEQAASVATADMVAAQNAAVVSQARLAVANEANAIAQANLNSLQQSSVATSLEIGAAQEAAALAAAEVTAARAAQTAATTALTASEEALAAVTAGVVATEEVATVSTITLTGAVTGLALAIGAVVAIAGGVLIAGFAIAKSFSDAGSELHDLAEETGLTAEELSVLKFAAEGAGSSLDKVTLSFQKYLKNINEAANGNKEAAKTFAAVGIDAEKANKDTTDALEQLFVAISKIPPGAQQVNAAMKLAGKSGADLIPVINQAGGSFVKFREEAEKLGVVISTDSANAADEFGDTLVELMAILTGIKNEIGAELLPTMLDLAKSLAQFLVDNRQGISDLAGVISVAINIALGAFYLLGGTIGYLANLIYGLITAVVALATSLIDVASVAIQSGKAVAQFIGGDITGAVATMNGAVNATRSSIQGLVNDLNRAATIISQPTFTSFFKLLNGGDGSTSKTNAIPKPKAPGGFAPSRGGGGKKGGGTSDVEALNNALLALEKARLQAQNDLLKDSIKTEQEILKDRFEQNLISYKQYYDALGATQLAENAAAIELQRKLIEIETRQLSKAKKGSERVKAETDILKLNTELEILERNRENISRRTSAEIRKQAQAYADMIAGIREQLQDLEGERVDAARTRIDRSFRDELAKAQARAAETGDDADVKRIQRLKELLLATERVKILEDEINDQLNERNQLEDTLANKVATGAITQAQANEQLRQFENDEAAGIRDKLAAMTAFADKVGDPKLKQAAIDIGLTLQKWGINQGVRDVDLLKSKLDSLQTALDLRNQQIDTALTNGALNDAQAAEQRKQAVIEYEAEAQKLLTTLEAIAVATKNAELQNFVNKARADISSLKADSDDLAISINQGFGAAFTDLFSSIADGTKGAKEAFADFGRSILKVLSDVLVKIIVTKIAMAALGGGGQGGLGGILSGLLGGDKAASGFASGGYTGGKEDEVAGLVHGREFVINADATARNRELLEQINSGFNPQRNLGAGSNVNPVATMASTMSQNLKVVNVLPNDLLDNYVTSPDGSRAILNFIDQNVNAINAKLKQ